MTKDSFRVKRCLIFRDFSKVLNFASHERFFLFGFISCTLPFYYSYCCFTFMKNTILIIRFPGGSPSTVSLWFAINLVYKMLPHWRWWELLDIQSTDVGLHQEFGTSVWSKQTGAPAELRACRRAWSGFGPANCSKITGTLASELKFFFVLCPVFSLLCHSLSSGLWICPLSH